VDDFSALHVFACQGLFISIRGHMFVCDTFVSVWIVGRVLGVRAWDIGSARLGGGITLELEERDGQLLFPLLNATSALLLFFFSLAMLVLEGGACDGLSGYFFGDGLGQRRFLCRLYVFPCVCFNFSIDSFPCTDVTCVSCCVVSSILCAHGIIFAVWRDRVTRFLDERIGHAFVRATSLHRREVNHSTGGCRHLWHCRPSECRGLGC